LGRWSAAITPTLTELSTDGCRVACLSDTYGLEANNGVGRFLYDLRELARVHGLPLQLFVAGKGDEQPGLHFVRAPSFRLPGYADVQISVPLEHHRKAVRHAVQDWRPDVLHVSTPGPLGCFGIRLGQQLRLPLVGIYHTNFPEYARQLVQSELTALQGNPAPLLDALGRTLFPLVSRHTQYVISHLSRTNPEFSQDAEAVTKILHRNVASLCASSDWVELGGRVVEAAVVRALRRFYSHFALVIARSPAQEDAIRKIIGVKPEQIRCLVPGTDVERFHPEYKRSRVWEPFGLPPGAFVVLSVGRITPEKNFDFLLDVWQQVQLRRQPTDRTICLVVVGRGERDIMCQASALPGVQLLGTQGPATLSSIYASADVLLFPSVTETLGQVGLEAGASGLPVIVSDQGGPRMYVRDGLTGYILPTNDAARWAEQVWLLARDESLRRNLGAQARKHVVANHTLKASLSSYWDIHREAADLAREERATRQSRRLSATRALPTASGNMAGVLVLTDYHAGKRFGTAKHQVHKEAALESMLGLAIEGNLDVIYGGDFADHGARPQRLEHDFAMLRRVQERVGLPTPPVLVRGNHDYGYTDQQLAELTGGARVHHSLVYFHQSSRVTVTHGHVLGLHRLVELIRSADGPAALELALREDRLDEDLKPSLIAYDLANLVESYVHQKGLTGLGTFWEALYAFRATVAENLLLLARHASRKDERTWKLIASLVGTHDHVDMAALLGVACGGWATVFGHTHEPLACTVPVSEPPRWCPSDQAAGTHVIGNAGNMNRKRPSCVIARFPEVRVYRYVHKTRKLLVAHRAWLPEPALAAFEKHMTTASCGPSRRLATSA